MTTTKLGPMRHRLALEDATATPDGGGGASVTWSLVAEVWAALTPLSGREGVEADGLQGRVTHEIVLRHRAGISPRQRFRMGARVFDIKAVIDIGERHRFLRCLTEERIG